MRRASQLSLDPNYKWPPGTSRKELMKLSATMEGV
ncbi:hypothetical protein ABIA85_007904 [Bradyrhizobium sp. LA6.10]